MTKQLTSSFALLFLMIATVAFAKPGDLDPSFGTDGTFVLSTGSRDASAILRLADGRFLVGGTENLDALPITGFSVFGLTVGGTLDPTLTFDGAMFGGNPMFATSLVRQPDGMVVQAGALFTVASGAVMAAVRYETDGDLDPAFGTGGVALVDFPGAAPEQAMAVGLQSDGKIVLGGYALQGGSTSHLALARLDTDGTLDTTFGTGGRVDFSLPGSASGRADAMLVLPDDRLIVAGESDGDSALLRFEADGTLDTTFAVDGAATTSGTGFRAVARQSDGALVAVANDYVIIPFGVFVDFPVVVRFDAEGAPDPTFDADLLPVAYLLESASSSVSSVAIAADGSIVLGGATASTNGRFMLIRLDAIGHLDTGFGQSNGIAVGPLGGIAALVQQPDTRIVAAGTRIENDGESTAVVARFFGGTCGNGTTEPDEICDDGNLTSGDGCDANCTPTGCGNGVVTAGEACDDGNVASGDCCSAACALDAAGVACGDDGNLCTSDACDGAGACVHPVEPAATCTATTVPGSASVQLTMSGTHKAQFKWTKGGATLASELGDPTTATKYALCVYDHAAGVPQLAQNSAVAGGAVCRGRPCWRATSHGFAYKDNSAAHGGVYSMQLSASSTPGKSKVVFTGKGVALPWMTLPLQRDPNVVVQLRNSVGGCWGATFGSAKRNDAAKFNAKSD
jgi:uncharacterized delta-60 repeat protein